MLTASLGMRFRSCRRLQMGAPLARLVGVCGSRAVAILRQAVGVAMLVTKEAESPSPHACSVDPRRRRVQQSVSYDNPTGAVASSSLPVHCSGFVASIASPC
jgi:hypothetical protein